jgi:hypothetical protein
MLTGAKDGLPGLPGPHAWQNGALILAGLALWLVVREREALRARLLKGRLGRTALSRFAEPLQPAVTIIAEWGAGATPKSSLDTTIMRTNLGLRLLGLVLSGTL